MRASTLSTTGAAMHRLSLVTRMWLCAGLFVAAPASASPVMVPMPTQCGSLDEVAHLIGQAGERLLLVANDDTIGTATLQVWTNLDTGTLSVVRVIDAQRVCLVASGTKLEPYTGPQPAPPGDPA